MGDSERERKLLELLAADDDEAYRRLYGQFYAPLCLFAGHYVPDRDFCADVVQEVFISLLGSGIRFAGMNQLKAYLYNALRNKCLNHLRHQRVHEAYLKSGEYESEAFFEQAVIEEEAYALLTAAIEMLPPHSRAVLRLAATGQANAEIAAQLGLTLETVKSYKKEGKKRISALLRANGSELFLVAVSLLDALLAGKGG